ncbi:hypothetical protein TNCV_4485031 [Trichonephila clavipes]|nr:hypothetical protein TNCV_4485031 [Trichonephila clavipes]
MRESIAKQREVARKLKGGLAKLQLAQLEKVELQRVKNKALSLNPAAKFEEKQFKTLNKGNRNPYWHSRRSRRLVLGRFS